MCAQYVRVSRIILLAALFTLAVVAVSTVLPAQDNTGESDSVGQLLNQLVGSLASPTATPGQADGAEKNQNVIRGVCESKDRKYVYCKVNTEGGVRMVRQLSRSTCEDNWGFDKGGIWVKNGCRAEFEVTKLPDPTPVPTAVVQPTGTRRTITCESQNGKRAFCSADTSAGVKLVQRLSTSPCEGNWGHDSEGIWVDRGCRAKFSVGAPEATPTQTPIPRLRKIKCRSTDGRKAVCAADTSQGVHLIRQLTTSPCRYNWGYDSNGIWVTNNCQAEFEIGEAPSGPTKVTCRSKESHRKYCEAPVTTSIHLLKTLSKVSCRGNWGFGEKGLWVRNGCEAIFEVQ